MNHQKLKSKFPDHRLVRFISTTKACPLSLKERWVYSTLLWRFKCCPITKSRLSKWTGVDRTRTLPRILTRLSNLRLVVRDGKRFKAVEPTSDLMPWFASHIRGFGVNERLVPSYNWAVYIRSRDIIDNLVACADALGHHTAAKLASRFGVCGKTITAARRRLKAQPHKVDVTEAPKPEEVPIQKNVVSPVVVFPVTEPKQIALAGWEQPPSPPSTEAEKIVAGHVAFHKIEPNATKELLRLYQILQRYMSRKEIGQIISALVKKYGVADELDDALFFLLQRREREYVFGATYEKVMKDIGIVQRSEKDYDDLSMENDEAEEVGVFG
ncbi:MAG: hypothetical protein U0941_26795 [Planctomycetaceae bacterium]